MVNVRDKVRRDVDMPSIEYIVNTDTLISTYMYDMHMYGIFSDRFVMDGRSRHGCPSVMIETSGRGRDRYPTPSRSQ